MHDDQLREQFTRWAQPLQAARPPALPVLRRRARRRIAGRAAVAGLAVVGAAAVIAVSGYPRAGHAPARPPTMGGVPRYAVLLANGAGGRAAVVEDPVTGRILGRVTPPRTPVGFQWVAAAADDRTFVLAEQTLTGFRFYLLRLAADGTPGTLKRLSVPPLRSAQIYGMALTGDGSKLAVAWQDHPSGPVGHIRVTTLVTGATRTWTSALGSAGKLAWAGDRTLAFDWQDSTIDARSGLRLLDTGTPGANLLASRLLIPASFRAGRLSASGNPVITQDGSTVFATMASGIKTAVARFSARTGKLQAVLTRLAQSDWYCGVLWTDPYGRHLLTQCGTTQASIEGGHRTPIHLHQLIPASFAGFANTFAW